MATQIFSDKILNGNDLLQVGKVQIIADATGADEAVRKSQAEAIAASSVQSALVNSSGAASAETGFTSEFVNTALATKQNNMSIDPASTSYLEIVDGTKIRLKDLGITSTYRDTTHASLTAFIAAATFNGDGTITIDGQTLDKMTFIFLTTADLPQDRTFVYLGTNNGNADDFVAFGTNYNASEIRSLFNGTGTGILFDANTGVFTLDIGTGASALGGQTIPHGATFTTISPNTKLNDALVKLEALINAVDQSGADGTAALTTKLNNRDGVTGNSYGTFTGSTFPDNQSGKQLFQATETLIESGISDNAAIRSEASARAAIVDANLAAAVSALESADTTESTARQAGDASLQTGLNALSANLTTESNRAKAAEAANAAAVTQEVSDRETAVTAEATARQAADTAEATARTVADDALQDQINALAGSNIELVGTVGSDGIFDAVEADSRNGEAFTSIAMASGEVVLIDGDVTMLGTDFKVGDELMVKVSTITAGAMALSDFVYKKGSETDLTRANLDGDTVELDGSDKLRVTHGSIERTQLGAVVKAELDDTVSLTDDDQTITGKSLKIEQSDSELGASYGLYIKKTQTGSDALTGTARALLVENWVNSNGTGNPALPAYAHNTITSHYDGDCVDLSVVVAGAYCEANAKATSAVNAIGSYSVATDSQLGVNIGAFAAAENGATSNVSMLAYASTDGVGADRGVVGAVTSQSLALYSATRVADPFPYNDIAIVADAKYAPAGAKALYSYGDVVFEGGSVTVPSASADTDAVNLGDIKELCEIHAFNLSSGSKVITTSLDLTKVKPAEFMHGVSGVVIGFEYNSANSEVTITATGDNVASLTAVKMFLEQLPCDITNS